ncbi:cell division protein ZapA [Roseateles sp. SL47]|uniref:cell division protein ZapA n=1 Tax=Roseateles sp. SL47 TaxID=2995138 RepID=UPI00226EEB4C|nr:cell division protein ZapA [Roseateles sp. SL47]WAC72217.1 cell division protein ZapA [Roseateles sp. SL47]
MKQMEVTIMGQSYLLGCPEGGEAALTKAVGRVDKEMCAIRDSGKIKARERIAVLAALNLAFSLTDTAHGADGATAASPASPASAASASATTAASTAGLSSNGDISPDLIPEIDTLMKRLDEALAQDGQLL